MDKTTPAVSVIMAVYNGEDHLDECIASICSQTFSDFEFIIVNDASTDNTPQMLAEWQKKDARIRVLHNKVNQQRAISRNRAITVARAPLVAVIDADDHSLPERLAIQTEFLLANPDVQVVGGDMLIDGSGERWSHPRNNDEIRAGLFFDSCLFHPTVMLRKSILTSTKTWYRADLPLAQDYGMWADLLTFPDIVFHNIPQPLTCYRLHDQPRPGYREKQFSCANLVRKDILQNLGIEASADNMRCHLALLYGNAPKIGVTAASCAKYANILREANAKARLAASEALDKEIGIRLQRIAASEALERKA